MLYPSIDEISKSRQPLYSGGSGSQRGRQLVDGQKPLISVDSHKPVTVAIHEVNHGKVHYRKTKEGIK